MATLTPDQVRHIAKLARLKLSDEEVEKFSVELTSVLKYVEKISKVQTDDVELASQVTGITNRLREDEIASDFPSPAEMLAPSPLPIIDNQIQTPSAHG